MTSKNNHSKPDWTLQRETQYRWVYEGRDYHDRYEFFIEGEVPPPSPSYPTLKKEWSLRVVRGHRTLEFQVFWTARDAQQYAKDHLEEIIAALSAIEKAEERCLRRFYKFRDETGIYPVLR